MGSNARNGKFMLLLVLSLGLSIATKQTAAESLPLAMPNCRDKCGNVSIPFPFGIGDKDCYLDDTFVVDCDDTQDPPVPYLLEKSTNISITSISITDGELNVMQFVSQACYSSGSPLESRASLTVPMFTISNTKNKFTAIGCDTYAYINGNLDGETYTSGCLSRCSSMRNVKNGSCFGSGCCQIPIPKGLNNIRIEAYSFNNHINVSDFNPCSYAMLIEEDKFNFSSAYLKEFPAEKVPAVLDWAINRTSSICRANSRKNDSAIMGGSGAYRCQCWDGYEGNPYLSQGCKDIDECAKNTHDCKHGCENTVGNYTCPCPKGYEGDGRKSGDGCTPKRSRIIQLAVGLGVGFIALAIGSSWVYLGYRRWKLIKLKEKFFKQNGGFMLQQQLSRRQGTTETARIFTQEELEKATNKYDETMVVGKGGFGTVYKGILADGSVVAIKKSKIADQSQMEQFINEVLVLSQINHRNVVKLLGCCLETEVPLVVYEFVANGNLHDHIHNGNGEFMALPWEIRLRIAAETAGVLSYLHSATSIPIIHRDVKPTNILLDDKYTAKVSDFGASRLVPLNQTQLSTMVQGTLGYLDPEYLLTSELTEKSDVYSFGIVVLELITGKKAVSFDGPEEDRNLAMCFLHAMKEDRLFNVVDISIVREGNVKQIKEVAELAKLCLRVKGDERPTMKEVAMELEGLRLMVEHPWVNNELSNIEEAEYLLGNPGPSDVSTIDESMKAHLIINVQDGR